MFLVENLFVSYAQAPVLNGVSFSVDNGQILGITGLNGAGKTTLVKALSNTFGDERVEVNFDIIELNKENIQNDDSASRYKKGLHTSFEGRRLFGPLTVRENLLCAAEKGNKIELDSKLEAVLNKVPLIIPLLNKKAFDCSGGQQQLVSIARTLVEPVSLLILDEPTLGLSPSSIGQVAETLNSLVDSNISILILEQREKFIDEMTSSKFEIENGVLCQK